MSCPLLDGVVVEGVFTDFVPPDGAGDDNCGKVVLNYAKTLGDPQAKVLGCEAVAVKPLPEYILSMCDVVQLLAKDMRLSPEDLAAADAFDTDAAIGRGRGGCIGLVYGAGWRDEGRWGRGVEGQRRPGLSCPECDVLFCFRVSVTEVSVCMRR